MRNYIRKYKEAVVLLYVHISSFTYFCSFSCHLLCISVYSIFQSGKFSPTGKIVQKYTNKQMLKCGNALIKSDT